MSFMEAVQKVSDGKRLLELKGKPPITAFLSDRLFQETKEDLWQQAVHAASYPGAKAVYLMPDTHFGFGVPIGSVLVTEDTVIPAAVGYDISCGVLYMRAPGLTAHDIAPKRKREQWIEEVLKRVAIGLGSHRPELMMSTSGADTEEACRYGARASWIMADQNRCERPFLPVPDDYDPRVLEEAWKVAPLQLGSLGAGNHFIEMQIEPETGEVWVMVHSGSRGFGHKTAVHFLRRLKQEKGVHNQDDTWIEIDSPTGRDYLAAHNAAANYAIANRHTMGLAIDVATQVVFWRPCELFYEISHNLVQHETVDLVKHGYVHRKGATRAFPAKHSDLSPGGPWWNTGHPCLIPGSMQTGAAILYADKNAEESGFSVNHGSGRVLGRREAKEMLADMQAGINDEMAGMRYRVNGVKIDSIVTNHDDIPLDECSYAYKDLDEVLAVLTTEKVARVAHRMYPVANIKG